MIQMNRAYFVGIVCLLIAAFGCITSASDHISAADNVKWVKTYELTEDAAYIELTLEGFDGSFESSLTLPDGYTINNANSTRIQGDNGVYWTISYQLKSARKGVYTLSISAPEISYYNLKVYVPIFADIPNHWASLMITDFVQRGIVAGYGNGRFGPNDPVTGEALVKMAMLMLTSEQPNAKRQWMNEFRWKVKDETKSMEMGWQEYDFIPAKGEHWSSPFMKAASDIGITLNWTEKSLSHSFKRKDVALLIANVIRMVDTEKPKTASFMDIKELGKEYTEAIDLASSQAIISGFPDGSFKPEQVVTRAEAVKMLYRLEEYLK